MVEYIGYEDIKYFFYTTLYENVIQAEDKDLMYQPNKSVDYIKKYNDQ